MNNFNKEIVELTYNPKTKYLHNSDPNKHYGNPNYITLDFISRERAYNFGDKYYKKLIKIEDNKEKILSFYESVKNKF